MSSSSTRELKVLAQMTVGQLQQKYAALFGEATTAHNRGWLLRKIAWRIQALAEGDLSERARRRAAELANDADLRLSPPRCPALPAANIAGSDGTQQRLSPGTVITRLYKGALLEV